MLGWRATVSLVFPSQVLLGAVSGYTIPDYVKKHGRPPLCLAPVAPVVSAILEASKDAAFPAVIDGADQSLL